MSFLTGLTNLTNWLGNVIMPTLAGVFFVIAILRAARSAPFQYAMYAGFMSLMVSGMLRGIETFSRVRAWNDPDQVMPSFGLGALARRYAVNVMIFASWGLIYGIFCRLAIAINVNSMAALTSANSFAGALAGASQEVLLAVASVLFSVCILLIPVLAKRIVEGDLGSSMLTVLGTATALAPAMSFVAGAGGGSGSMQSASAGGGGGAAAGSGGGFAAASSNIAPAGPSAPSGGAGSGSRAPGGPSGGGSGGRGPGDYRPPNIPHAAGWLGGAVAAMAVQGGQKAVAAGRKMLAGDRQTAAAPTVSTRPQGPESVDEWI